ncbi:DUF1471 domain-containing protein [Flavivirga algicola]|uniref:DUF1471 domain-containing protein n=1 Tax=Flavivirga algicola TaxID=2729136 RepID=A0ABX1S1M8_9FLAO|nr:DUF1471 domain-containing protein [Flavivirga algicola]NMH89747.1 DUF1471 domain-containing protein [Flavivirga algicola]
MLKKRLFIVFAICNLFVFSQQKDSLSIKNGIENPSLLTTHHFGIFSSRINSNFKLRPPKKPTLSINSTSGNNFHPFVEAYFPKDPVAREAQSKLIWYERDFTFIDQLITPADYLNIVIDAVIKEFRLGINIPLNKKNELGITLRSYLIGKGKHPFSFFTSDESIEWFHSNISGGEDPFGRRYYGLNQVNFKYLDRNGNTLELNNNDFFIGGIEFNYFYYPTFSINKTQKIFINFGGHLGINTSRFNSSLDFGLSVNAIKKIPLKNNYEFNFGTGMNILHKNLIDFKEVIDLGNNPFLATIEGNLEIARHTKRGNYNSLSINYQIQSRYNKRKEADYFRLLGNWEEINGGWQHGVTTLYKAQSNWSFTYTYGRPKYKFSLYFKEDFLVNNAPDFQTGISLKIPILK